jgi:hypothetical protein
MCTGGVLNPNEPFGRHGLGAAGYLIPKKDDKKEAAPKTTEPIDAQTNKSKLKTNEST